MQLSGCNTANYRAIQTMFSLVLGFNRVPQDSASGKKTQKGSQPWDFCNFPIPSPSISPTTSVRLPIFSISGPHKISFEKKILLL